MKRRTPNQIVRDCARCERAKGAKRVCKKCDGAAHGLNRNADHNITELLSASQIQLTAGVAFGG